VKTSTIPRRLQAALQRARELRHLAESEADPPTRIPTDQAVEAFAQWMFERRDKSRTASTAYEEMLAGAAANEQVLVRREIGDLWFDFVESVVQKALALVPPGASRAGETADLKDSITATTKGATSGSRRPS